jgi:hypothetical protein
MTERERWIVYPLLFLALGAALRDKLVDRTTAKSIVCQELLIVDEESTGPQSQRVLAKIGRDKSKRETRPTATMLINGDLQIVDDDLSDGSQVRILGTFGRTDPPNGIPAEGLVDVRGNVGVTGAVSAARYVLPGLVILPVPTTSGGVVLGALNLVPQPGQKVPNPKAPKTQPPSQPPATGTKNNSSSTSPSSPADQKSPSDE